MENTFGERIKQFRETTDLNQTDFALKIGLARSTISLVESGKFSINGENLALMCQVFPKMNIEWLLTGKGEMLKSINTDTNRIAHLEELLKQKTEMVTVLQELLDKYRGQ